MEEPLDDNSFEEFLKGRFENLEADPATDAWDKIFGEINQDSPIPVQSKPWFVKKRWILIACILWCIPQSTYHIGLKTKDNYSITQSIDTTYSKTLGRFYLQNKEASQANTNHTTKNKKITKPSTTKVVTIIQTTKGSDKPKVVKATPNTTYTNKPKDELVIIQTIKGSDKPKVVKATPNTTYTNKPKDELVIIQTTKGSDKPKVVKATPNTIHTNKPKGKLVIIQATKGSDKPKVVKTTPNTTKPKDKLVTNQKNKGNDKQTIVGTNSIIIPKLTKKGAKSTQKNHSKHFSVSPLKTKSLPMMATKKYALELKKVPYSETKKKTKRGLLLRAFVAPTYNAHRLITNKEDEVIIQGLVKNTVFSGNNLGFSGGIMLENHLSRRWSVVWGLSYTQLNNHIGYSFRNTVPDSIIVDVVSSSEIIATPVYSSETESYRYKYQDVGVQMGINYLLFGKHWQHQLYLGVAINKATGTVTQTKNEVVKESSSRIQHVINLGYDLRLPLSKKVGFYIKPTFNYYLNDINQANTAYRVKPFFTSLRLGLIWKLQ
ncbi:hypothetical protein [uncultured Microscilla sp.]|uniref:hypothetical protein n=1 Tax=uncultured Microscilla sp. TaxID=432653 RepID=UPI0026059112|nr:hypothetical protein [uncultured Microscilla sp.]